MRQRRISAMCKTESVQMQGTREQADVPSHSMDSTEYDVMNDEPYWWEQGNYERSRYELRFESCCKSTGL